MGQMNEQIGFKITTPNRALIERVAEREGAPSVQRWVRDVAISEATRIEGVGCESAETCIGQTDDIMKQVNLLHKAESACKAIQQAFPAVQVDAAQARNALRHLISVAAMAASGGLSVEENKTGRAACIPDGWLTVNEARGWLHDRNGYSPSAHWFYKAKGRGLLVSPGNWRYCLVQRNAKGWRAFCLPQRWVEVVAPHIKRHARNVDWSVLSAALAQAGLLPRTAQTRGE